MKVMEFIERISKTQDNDVLIKSFENGDYLSRFIIDSASKNDNVEVDIELFIGDLKYAISELQKALDEAQKIMDEEEVVEESQMQDFEIPVVRIGYGFKTIKVRAKSQEEAEQLALDEAGNQEFSEKESDYKIG